MATKLRTHKIKTHIPNPDRKDKEHPLCGRVGLENYYHPDAEGEFPCSNCLKVRLSRIRNGDWHGPEPKDSQ